MDDIDRSGMVFIVLFIFAVLCAFVAGACNAGQFDLSGSTTGTISFSGVQQSSLY